MDLVWFFKSRRLIATRHFLVGSETCRIIKGTSLYFDGVTVKYGVESFTCPEMQAARDRGWLVPWYLYEKGNPEYGRPEAAPIQVTPARHRPLSLYSENPDRDGSAIDGLLENMYTPEDFLPESLADLSESEPTT